MKTEKVWDFMNHFFNDLESIMEFAGQVLKLAFTFAAITAFSVSLLVLIGLPFYGIAGYITSIPGKRIIFSSPFIAATILFIAWIGRVRSKWSS